jgi:hypothetical protein
MAAMAAMPSDADPLPSFPIGHALSELLDNAHNFVARYPRIGNARKCPYFCESIAVTYPACLDLDQNLAHNWIWDVPLDQLEWSVGVLHLNSTHAWHGGLPWWVAQTEMAPAGFITQSGRCLTVTVGVLNSRHSERQENPESAPNP